MVDVLDVEGAAPEVETEYEDDVPEDHRGGGFHAELEETEEDIQEEEEAEHVADAARNGDRRGDYYVPEANREVWKQFGCNTEAGRMLRRLYSGGAQSASAAKVSYPRLPSPARRWEPGPGPRKQCPQRAAVRVPRPTGGDRPDPDDPRTWRVPLPGRRQAADIQAEMHTYVQEKPPGMRPGRDQNKVKHGLQERFQYCGGRMMPPAAMGHVPDDNSIPVPAVNVAAERRKLDENGMTAEQREIFQDITDSIREKQARLAEIDANANDRPSKLKTERNKEALQLRNDIERCLRDMDKLLELTDD